ncbi:MAG: endonuclease/exonuclease/phosphatase family protein [Kofleriaceae bacterium]
MKAALLVLCACATGGDGTPLPENPARLRVLTYNMNFGVAGDRAGVDAIASAAPDIAVLQETNDEWERAIRCR